MIGARIPRVEDERFLRGEGRFVADLKLPFMLEACILRSPQAHARIGAIDAAAALSLAGVVAVVTAADLPGGLPPIPCRSRDSTCWAALPLQPSIHWHRPTPSPYSSISPTWPASASMASGPRCRRISRGSPGSRVRGGRISLPCLTGSIASARSRR